MTHSNSEYEDGMTEDFVYLPMDGEVFNYLDGLRDSGITNMFGAAQFIAAEFDIPQREARAFLVRWMQRFVGIETRTEVQ